MSSSLSLLLLAAVCSSEPTDTNIIITNVTIHDGTGAKPVVGDVQLKGERIHAVGQVGRDATAQIIDGKGLLLCPGFIDLHTHCESGLQSKSTKANKNYILQGCTTVVTGNCGSGPVDVKAYFDKLTTQGIGTNCIHLATHNDIREKVMGNADQVPTAEQQKKMESLVEQAMKDGAWGLSTGLIYNPGTYSKTEEIIGLAKVAGKYDGIYASHIRDEGSGLLTAIEEAIRIGKEGHCAVHVSHIKASGKSAHGSSVRAVAMIETARKMGQTVTADQYPYIASSTSLRAILVPSRYREGTSKEYIARYDDPTTGPKLKADIEKALDGRAGGKNIQIARYSPNTKWNGKTILTIAEAEKKEPIDIVIEIEKNGGAQVVNFGMTEEDVRIYMKQPWVATASDGGVQTPGDTVPHPRSYGTFPRKISLYAMTENILPLEAAIRSCTGLPAEILKLKDRGTIRVGYYADVVIFDPKTFTDTATYDKPHQYPTGLKYVFVNGRAVVANGDHKPEVLAGKTLRHGMK